MYYRQKIRIHASSLIFVQLPQKLHVLLRVYWASLLLIYITSVTHILGEDAELTRYHPDACRNPRSISVTFVKFNQNLKVRVRLSYTKFSASAVARNLKFLHVLKKGKKKHDVWGSEDEVPLNHMLLTTHGQLDFYTR
jgi:hypothetical protein